MRYYRRRLFENDAQDVDVPEKNVEAAGTPVARKADDSVDDQIDSLILMYEKNAIRTEMESINESIRRLSLTALLLEQEEELEDSPAEEGDSPAEEPEEDQAPTGSEEMTAKAAEKQKVPDLDIDKFTIDVARLTMNAQQLLDIEKAIINRAKNFLDKQYGDAYVKAFLETLENQFGVKTKEFDVSYSSIDAPFAVGANPAGAGSVGG
jgi:hypothetical protein